jgi:hypothetical protein
MIGLFAWGAVLGIVVSGINWVFASPERASGVSTVRGVLPLISLVVLSAIALRVGLPSINGLRQLAVRATALGLGAGSVIALETAARGIARWSQVDPRMVVSAIAISLLGVIALVYITAIAVFLPGRPKRQSRALPG